MSSPFVGEIRMFGGNFAPAGWALCDGQLLAISQNDTLFSLLGTIYGGDGETTFGLPDLRGRVPIHMGTLPGGGNYPIGQRAGTENVTLTTNQLPLHTHTLTGTTSLADSSSPSGNVLAQSTTFDPYLLDASTAPMAVQSTGAVGGGFPHNNLQPFTCINFIISLFGIYPSRS